MRVEIDHGEASDTPIPSLSASAGTVRLNAIRLASLEMVHRGGYVYESMMRNWLDPAWFTVG